MGVKTSSKRAPKKAPARKTVTRKTATKKAPVKKAVAKKAASKKTPVNNNAVETKYQCKKCKRKITVLVGVSSVWCNRCSTVMLPI